MDAWIDGRKIGPDEPPYIIADLSCNHLGNLDNALKLIELSKWAGADAIKPQLYTPAELCKPGTIAHEGPWKGQDLYELYEKYQTPREWFPPMIQRAKEVGITLFSSVFSLDGVDFLESLSCPAYKIAANEYNWTPLIEKVRGTGKPVLISVPNFMSLPDGFIQLLNVPGYPLALDKANMALLPGPHLDLPIYGLSSHLMDPKGMVMAVALGCSIIEAHIAIDLSLGGPDTSFSWEPAQFKAMADDCHVAWRAMRPRDIKLPGFRRGESGLRETWSA